MGFVNYSVTGDKVEIIVRDFSGAKIETHTCQVRDKKKFGKILKYLKNKYGFEPEITPDESVNIEEGDWWK